MEKQQVVLISGCSCGMGKATAHFLAQRGYIVYAGSRTPEKLASIQNKNLIPIYLDITNQEQINTAVSSIQNQHQHIDILINNAGYGLVSAVEHASEEEMFNQFNINVFGVLRLCKTVIPNMRENRQGVIINISSFLGKIGLPLLTFYNASKYAVEGITDSLRYELEAFNIRVHSIMPGFFDTQFARKNLVTNESTFQHKEYEHLSKSLAPQIVNEINEGNNANEIAKTILTIIENKNFQARITSGDKAQKFIPMRQELSDEDFERRVKDYYSIG